MAKNSQSEALNEAQEAKPLSHEAYAERVKANAQAELDELLLQSKQRQQAAEALAAEAQIDRRNNE